MAELDGEEIVSLNPGVTWKVGDGPIRVIYPSPSVVLVLPEPPSANRWWRKWRGKMVLSAEARAYKIATLQRAGVKDEPLFPDGELAIVIVWRRKRKDGDLDKRVGVLLDALQTVWGSIPDNSEWARRHRRKTRNVILAPGVYNDDSQIVQLWARRCDEHPELEPGTVRVEVSRP